MADALYIDHRGQVVSVESGTAAEDRAWRLGWAPASIEQARDYYFTQQHSGGGQAVIAGLEAAGRMLSFGGLTHLETALGVSPESIAARERANPVAADVGGALGVIVPLLATGGTSAAAQGAARGAALTGPSLLARAGTATAQAVAKALPAGASTATRVAAKGLAAAAGGAVEGMGYEVGQLVHEAGLGDPNFTAESALARVGLAGATFGALAGGGGILGQLTREGAGIAGRALEGRSALAQKLEGWLEDVEARSNLKASGAIQSDIAKAERRTSADHLHDVAMEMRDRGLLRGPLDTPAKVLERAEALKEASPIGRLLREADAGASGQLLGDLPAVVRKARQDILKPLAGNPLETSAATRFGEALDQYEAMGAQTLEGLHRIRRQFDDKVFSVGDPDATALRRAFRKTRNLISQELDAGMRRARPSAWGKEAYGRAWKEANREYEVAAQAADFARAGLRRSTGNNLISPTEFLSVLGGSVHGGPVGGVAGGLATALFRRQGSATLGWMSNRLRATLAKHGQRVASGTAEALAAERAASSPWGMEAARQASAKASPFQRAPASQAAVLRRTGLPPPGVPANAAWHGMDAGAQRRQWESWDAWMRGGVSAQATSAPETAAALSVLEEAQQETRKRISESIRRILKATPGAVGRAVAAHLATTAAAPSPEDVRRLVSAPDAMLDALAAQADDIQPHAPTVAQAAQLASVRAVSFLASKAPTATLPGLLAPKAQPSYTEMAKFRRYAEVVDNPEAALVHAERGTLAPEHVEALAAVWPAIHEEVQRAALWEVMERRGAIAPQSRFMLSLLTGMDMDGALASIATHQAVYQQPSHRPDAAAPRRDTGNLTLASRSATPHQRRQERSA